jgi:hypothetical protein
MRPGSPGKTVGERGERWSPTEIAAAKTPGAARAEVPILGWMEQTLEKLPCVWVESSSPRASLGRGSAPADAQLQLKIPGDPLGRHFPQQ